MTQLVFRRFFSTVFLFTLLPCYQAPAEDDPLRTKIERLARPYVAGKRIVGVSIGVLKDGEPTTIHLGRSSRKGERPNDDTVYEIGSISKVFTGILLADGVVRERLRLEQPVSELVPNNVKMPSWKDRPMTLVDLATHRSGLPRLASNMRPADPKNPYADYTSEKAYEFLNEHQLRRSPGEAYEYSNIGMSLVGHLIGSAQNLSFEELLRQRITEPLAMTSTAIKLSESMEQRLAEPHTAFGTPTSTWEQADLPGAGGIRSTTADMLRFLEAQLSPPAGELGRAIELARKQHSAEGSMGPAMGLGWHIGKNESRWHNGQTGGYHSMLLVNRKTNTAAVVLANTAYQDTDGLALDVMQLLDGAEVSPRTFEEPIQVSTAVMKRYVGKYQLTPDIHFTVSVQDGGLMIGLTNQPTFQVFARSETEWFYIAVDATVRFQLENGECQALQLLQNGITQTAKRIE